MDTKLKANHWETPEPDLPLSEQSGKPKTPARWPAVIMCIALAAALAASLIGISIPIYNEAKKTSEYLYGDSWFLETLCHGNYTLYWKMAQRVDGTLLSPIDLFYPGARENLALREADDEFPVEDGEDSTQYLQNLNSSLQNSLLQWYEEFQSSWEGYNYLVLDTVTGQSFGNSDELLTRLVNGEADQDVERELQNAFSYYIVMSYDENGHLTVPALSGAPDSSLDNLQEADYATNIDLLNNQYVGEYSPGELQGPRNAVFAYGVPRVFTDTNWMSERFDNILTSNFSQMGYAFYYVVLIFAATFLGYCMTRTKRFALPPAKLAVVPFEILVVISIVAVAMWYSIARLTVQVFSESITFWGLGSSTKFILSLLILAIICFVVFGAMYCVGTALREIRVLGGKEYFRRHSLIIGNAMLIRKGFVKFYNWLTRIDLTQKSNRSLIKFLVINYIILALICLTWGFGLILLVVYSLVLFGILRKRMRKIKQQYATLLDATTEMAKGRLDVRIDGDLGMFEPVKQELVKIQAGFTQAVEAETKSQNMKTELITNVSHDLKTPLTAIITYVDLLKKEGLTEEEHRAYVGTLDTKSQRLKRLIDDLFEMSKASSRDISLNISDVDLPALIRQVETECRDELAGAGVEFRYQFPDDRIVLPLDGDKTSRIFENLVLNVAKYSLHGTRAYVSIQIAYGFVYVEIKNVSQTELVFEGDITERFVRGDLSRSTEGSGLGLAIAKSFTEAQGGSFAIATDGDIFKALVVFPLPRQIPEEASAQ